MTTFAARKRAILAALADPDGTDRSPKGSVDAGIRALVHEVNALPGLVTTSSCAGRVSVFAEGGGGVTPVVVGERERASAEEAGGDSDTKADADHAPAQQQQQQRQFVAAGGKGSGRWLFVSHDPVPVPPSLSGQGERPRACQDDDHDDQAGDNCDGDHRGEQGLPLHRLFGLEPGDGTVAAAAAGERIRLIRFHWEPMILHIMAATLPAAGPVLAAASAAGFRESGLQSLRCLCYATAATVNSGGGGAATDDEAIDASASPVVAVRSAGLALESVIGYVERRLVPGSSSGGNTATNKQGTAETETEVDVPRSLVSESYLRLLLDAANARFARNEERKARFRDQLLRMCGAGAGTGAGTGTGAGVGTAGADDDGVGSGPRATNTTKAKGSGKGRERGKGKKEAAGEEWEDAEVRRQRMRAEGLRRRDELRRLAVMGGLEERESERERKRGGWERGPAMEDDI